MYSRSARIYLDSKEQFAKDKRGIRLSVTTGSNITGVDPESKMSRLISQMNKMITALMHYLNLYMYHRSKGGRPLIINQAPYIKGIFS